MTKYLSTHNAVGLEVLTLYSAEEETSLKPKVRLCAEETSDSAGTDVMVN